MMKAESKRVRHRAIPLANPRRVAPPVETGMLPSLVVLGPAGTREALADGLNENDLEGDAEGRDPPTTGVLEGLEDEDGTGMIIAVVVIAAVVG